MSQQYLFSQYINQASGLTADNFMTSAQFERISRVAQGGGVIGMTGAYTGDQDATFEFEILNDTINNAPVMSEPITPVIGNGTISSVAATAGTDAQDYTVVLVDRGEPTEYARLQFRGVVLRAKTAGAAGNLITLSVDHSGLTKTASNYSLQSDVSVGNSEFTGSQWNWDAPELIDGQIPSDAPRYTIGDGTTVYRHYKKFVDGQYVYAVDPPITEDAPAGTPIYLVTGDREVTITNGTTTNTHSNITTIYDLLSAIQSSSTLLDVIGDVILDRAPGGHGIRDLNDRTAPYVRRMDFDGSEYVTGLDDVTVPATAKTELFRFRCISARTPGAEIWSAKGDVSGEHSNATTGVAYSSTALNATIPIAEPTTQPPDGTISVTGYWQNRAADESPLLCDDKVGALLGSAAQNMTVTFTLQPRPLNDCDCDGITLSGFAREDCLGIEPPENAMGTLTAPILARLETLTEAKKARIAASTSGTLFSTDGDKTDLLLIGTAYAIAGSTLVSLSAGDLEPDAWVTATAYEVDDVVEPTTADGYRYRATVAGTTGGSEPTWPAEGATVVDGGVTWLNIGKKPLGQFDDEFAAMDAKLAALLDSVITDDLTYQNDDATARANTMLWSASYTFTAQDVIDTGGKAYILPTTRNGHLYYAEFVEGNQLSGSEPTWPTNGGSVTDNDVIWYDLGSYWEATTAHTVGQHRYIPELGIIKCVVAGDTDSTEPTWPVNPPVGHQFTDDGVTWEIVDTSANELTDSTVAVEAADRFVERYRAAFSDVLMTAGIAPNFDDAGLAGSLCWQDTGDEFWWVPDNGSLPAFTNVGYHEAYLDADGNVQPTKRFFFYPALACDDQAQEGDTITVKIDGVGQVYQTYQVGDEIKVAIVYAAPLGLTGGKDGDNTLTWRVTGTVDGVLADYELDLDSPAAYSDSGLSFLITQGSIPFALGDFFSFSAEGGQFRWRKDGGSWTTDDIADTVALSDGVSASFDRGKAPSFLTGDTTSIKAVAVNGPQRAETPDDTWMEWATGSATTIDIPGGFACSGVFLSHEIDSGAEVRFQGSDDSFSSTPLDEVITNTADCMAKTWDAVTYADYRIVIDSGAGRLRWICCGTPTNFVTAGEVKPTNQYIHNSSGINGNGQSVGHTISCEWDLNGLSNDELASLRAVLQDAYSTNQGRVGLHLKAGDCIFGKASSNLPATEFTLWHPTDPSRRFIKTNMQINGVI